MIHKPLLLGFLCGATVVWTTRAGSLTGSFTPVTSGSVINLTASGNIDWAHWGLSATNLFNHKVGVGQISNFSIIGPNTASQYSTNRHGYSWSEGQPTPAATNATTGVLIQGVTNGFSISVPADTT